MTYDVDVVVAGAGSAGMVAAIASARNGTSTLLIERGGFLGGVSTAVLDTMYAFYAPGEAQEKVVSGLPDEIVKRIDDYDAVLLRPNTFGSGTGITYNPETLKRVWDDFAREAGVRVLLHSFVTGALTEGERVTGLTFVNKGGAHRSQCEGSDRCQRRCRCSGSSRRRLRACRPRRGAADAHHHLPHG